MIMYISIYMYNMIALKIYIAMAYSEKSLSPTQHRKRLHRGAFLAQARRASAVRHQQHVSSVHPVAIPPAKQPKSASKQLKLPPKTTKNGVDIYRILSDTI